MSRKTETERRYFKLSGALHSEAEEWRLNVYEAYKARLKAFIEEIGTDNFLMQGGAIVGFLSTEQSAKVEGTRPSTDFEGYLVPNRRQKAGQALVHRFDTLDRPRPMTLLRRVAPDQPWFIGSYMIWASFAYSEKTDTYFISVPVLAAYTPPDEYAADLIPVKAWEFMRDMEADEHPSIAVPT
jgi:hypothetical protein